MSVLSALRACVSSGEQPRVEGNLVHPLRGVVLPRKASTAWHYRESGYLDLDSIAFFLDNERLPLTQYVKAATDADAQIVPSAERKLLLAYLRGENNGYICNEIDQERDKLQQQGEERKQSRRRSLAPHLCTAPVTPASLSGQIVLHCRALVEISGRTAELGAVVASALLCRSSD